MLKLTRKTQTEAQSDEIKTVPLMCAADIDQLKALYDSGAIELIKIVMNRKTDTGHATYKLK